MRTLYAVGDKPGELPKVTKLSREERELRESVQRLKDEKDRLQRLVDGVGQILEDAQASCSHRAFHDEAGFIYDMRSCGICGAGMGLL